MKAAISLAFALSLTTGGAATADQLAPKRGPFCAERAALVAQLRAEYQEPTALGQMGPQRLLEIFIARNGDWTVLITEASGVSCIVAAGDNWDSKNLIFAQST